MMVSAGSLAVIRVSRASCLLSQSEEGDRSFSLPGRARVYSAYKRHRLTVDARSIPPRNAVEVADRW